MRNEAVAPAARRTPTNPAAFVPLVRRRRAASCALVFNVRHAAAVWWWWCLLTAFHGSFSLAPPSCAGWLLQPLVKGPLFSRRHSLESFPHHRGWALFGSRPPASEGGSGATTKHHGRSASSSSHRSRHHRSNNGNARSRARRGSAVAHLTTVAQQQQQQQQPSVQGANTTITTATTEQLPDPVPSALPPRRSGTTFARTPVVPPFVRRETWLEDATAQYLDPDRFPLGELASEDVDAVGGLMAAWARRGNAATVERLLKRIADDVRANNPQHSSFSRGNGGGGGARLRTRLYTHAMEAWARSGTGGAAQRAQQIHDALVQSYKRTGDPLLAPSVLSHNVLLNGWAKSRDPMAIHRAERILSDMLRQSRHGKAHLAPDAVTFTTILDIYAKSLPPSPSRNRASATTATAVVARCEELVRLMDKLGISRTAHACSALQNAHARSGLPDSPARARAILDDMLERAKKSGDPRDLPNRLNYNAVLHALSRAGTVQAAREADAFLERMEHTADGDGDGDGSNGNHGVEPDRLSYALTIFAAAQCPDAELAAELAERNLDKMRRRAHREELRRAERSSAAPPAVRLDAECCVATLTAVSHSRRDDAYTRARAIVDWMDLEAGRGQPDLRPGIRCWNAVLHALARTPNAPGFDAPREANDVMERVLARPDLRPNAFTFALVLTCYQRSPRVLAERADALVKQMEELHRSGNIDAPPDVYHLTILCGIWAQSLHLAAPDRCMEILAHMQERHRAGVPNIRPNVRTYNAVLDCLCRAQQQERAEQLLHRMLGDFASGDTNAKPDAFSFNCVIRAHCRSTRVGSGTRAETVLDRFLEFGEEHPDTTPDARSFTHIVAHYARSRDLDAPYRAEYMLHRLVAAYEDGLTGAEPNDYAFAAVIDSYARAKHPDAGRNAERLLQLMKRLREEHPGLQSIGITTAVMKSVLHAWARCGDEDAGRQAERHLDDMERRTMAAKDTRMGPDARSYRLVLSAWSKSGAVDKAERALCVLRRLQEHVRRGNDLPASEEIAYSLVINACAFTTGSIEAEAQAFRIAVDVLDELLSRTDVDPTPQTFVWFFQACRRLRASPGLQESHAVRAFDECRHRGLVTGAVLLRFREAASDEAYERLVVSQVVEPRQQQRKRRTGPLLPIDLPHSWSRQCPGAPLRYPLAGAEVPKAAP